VTPDNAIIIKNPAEFFNFDNSEYQYIGIVNRLNFNNLIFNLGITLLIKLKKRVAGVNTDVWTGPKLVGGYNAIYEWHFLASSWNKTDILPSSLAQIPILLRIYLRIPIPGIPDLYVNNIKSFLYFVDYS
jgi:hypothetical protein